VEGRTADVITRAPFRPGDGPTFEIGRDRGLPTLGIRELWTARGLFGFLVWRDVKVRYAQTVLGIAWVVLQPLTTTLVFALVFGRLAHLPSDGAPYPAFAFIGLIVWTFFSSAVAGAGISLVEEAALLKKVYFPRLFIPLSPVAVALFDAGVALTVLAPVLVVVAPPPRWAPVFAIPVFLLIAVAACVGVGAALAALNLRYRDFRYVIPFLLQGWMFVSPIAYPTSMVPAAYRAFYALNPLVGAVEGCRWALLGTPAPTVGMVGVSAVSAAVMFAVGTLYFRWSERTLVDVA
jgi:lipopolysaccharide transport system permease protein